MAEVILVRAGSMHLEGAELVGVVLSAGGIHPVEGVESVAVKTLSFGRVVDVNMDLFPLKSWPQSKLQLKTWR